MIRTIAENLIRLSDEDLLVVLPYIRNANGEKISNIREFRDILQETVKQVREKRKEQKNYE